MGRGKARVYQVGGERLTAMEMAEKAGVEVHTILQRMKRGMTPEEAVRHTAYKRRREYMKYRLGGERMSCVEIGRRLNYSFQAFQWRARKSGRTVQEEIDAEWRMRHEND